MAFEYLNKIKDASGDIARLKKRIKEAEDFLSQKHFNESVSKCFEALKIMVRYIYKNEDLNNPVAHGEKLADADYIHRESPFAKWLHSQELLDKCHHIRVKRNQAQHSNDSKCYATEKDAKTCMTYLDDILKNICGRLSKESIRNPGDAHQACVILLDISGSMLGAKGTPVGSRPIDELNSAIREFKNALESVEEANGCTEVCFITFSDEVEVIQSFRNADRFNVPKLSAGGCTAMNEAIERALDVIERQKKIYQENGVFYYRPWMFLFSDGMPTDKSKENSAKVKLQEAIEGKHVIYFPTSIGNWADREFLSTYYPKDVPKGSRFVLNPKKGEFKNAFVWLSNSLAASIKNKTDKDFTLPAPQGFKIERY